MIQELGPGHLETFFDYLGGELIGTVLGGKAKDMLDGTTLVSRTTVLANVLDTPITELAMRDNVDTTEDFVDARTL